MYLFLFNHLKTFSFFLAYQRNWFSNQSKSSKFSELRRTEKRIHTQKVYCSLFKVLVDEFSPCFFKIGILKCVYCRFSFPLAQLCFNMIAFLRNLILFCVLKNMFCEVRGIKKKLPQRHSQSDYSMEFPPPVCVKLTTQSITLGAGCCVESRRANSGNVGGKGKKQIY